VATGAAALGAAASAETALALVAAVVDSVFVF
jgi:hypothetical protein